MTIHKYTKVMLVAGFITALVCMAASCRKDPPMDIQSSPAPLNISFQVPAGWPAPVYNFNTNKLTDAGFILGRKLFYETLLSKDNTISCSSCHQQFAAFSHLDHAQSHGIYGLFGTRNAPGLFNLNWQQAFMWDGGINSIEVQPLAPIANPVEMDETIGHVVQKLSAGTQYPALFKAAFGSDTINSQRILKALAQFMGALVSANSRYDKYVRGEQGGTLSTSEQNGLQLFNSYCKECHPGPLFTDFSYRSIGLPVDTTLNDYGRVKITGIPTDSMKFKVPSLRNVGLTRPYMHDGRYKTLQECLDFFASDPSHFNRQTDPFLKNGLPLNASQKTDIINFLGTLSDETFINDARFKNPN